MTVSTNDTIERYTISGAGPYAYSWRIFNDTDLTVVALSTASPPAVVPLTLLTHYTVTGANESDGGSITLTSAAYTPYAGYTLDIRGNTPEDQPTSIRNQARFLPEIHEDAFDYLARQIQDLQRRVDRCVRFSDDTLTEGEMTPIQSWLSKYLAVGPTGLLEPTTLTSSGALTQAIISGLFYPQNAQELAAGVTPSTYIYPYGDPRRAPTLYDNSNWINYGDVGTYISNTSFSIPTDVTARYPFASYLKLLDTAGAAFYCRVQAAAFASVTTFTVTGDGGNVPNPIAAVYKAEAMLSDRPSTTRWDLNLNSGTFTWNVNNGSAATAKVAVACGTSGLGADFAMNIAVMGSAHTSEYLTGSGVTGRQFVLHSGVAGTAVLGIADQTRQIWPVIGSPIKFMGSAESWAIVSPREGDSLGGAWASFYKSAAQGGQRKGYFGFAGDGANNTFTIANEVASSNIKVEATGNIWLAPTGGLVYLDAAANVYYKYRATGSPEGADTANVGSLVTRGDNANSLYVKQTGTGNTGWVLK